MIPKTGNLFSFTDQEEKTTEKLFDTNIESVMLMFAKLTLGYFNVQAFGPHLFQNKRRP